MYEKKEIGERRLEMIRQHITLDLLKRKSFSQLHCYYHAAKHIAVTLLLS